MGPLEQTQCWFPKQIDHGMCLLDELIKKVCTFQTPVARFAMKADMWVARCQIMHPGGVTGTSSRKSAVGEYAGTLKRTERKHIYITKSVYMGLPSSKRKTLMEQWQVASPP